MALTRAYEGLKKRFDDSDVESPLHFKYIGQLRFVMSTVGAWPHRQFGRPRLDAALSLYNLFLIMLGIVLMTLGGIYVWAFRDDISFFDIGHVLLCMLFEVCFLQKLALSRVKKYRETLKDYLLEFHLFYIKNRSEYAAKIHSQIHVISGMFTLFVMSEVTVGLSLFTFMPWYNNYSRGMFSDHRPPNTTFEQAVYYYLFTDYCYTTIKGYWMLFTLNLPISYVTIIGVCFFDLILCLIVFQIWGHLRILEHNLLSMPRPATDGMYSVEENQQIRQQLKDNIVHHTFIIAFTDKCSDAFSEYLLVFYMCMQFISCILLLEVSSFTADALVKYGPLTFGMHQQLIQVSVLFEMLDTKSKQLTDAVYATPWELMDTANRRTVLFFLHRVQTPVTLKAAKVVPVGIMTMSAILKTSISYYMMLNAVAGER